MIGSRAMFSGRVLAAVLVTSEESNCKIVPVTAVELGFGFVAELPEILNAPEGFCHGTVPLLENRPCILCMASVW